jgi:beta-aspartyl-peptidase (threonine type)
MSTYHSKQRWRIIVHGGAGPIRDGLLAQRQTGCQRAAEAGAAQLAQGYSALDAVQSAVAALEDDPLFNAGTGAVLNCHGKIQLDASIMNGANLAAGAVAAVSRLKNPICLARQVLEDGRHVLLAGESALEFARSVGLQEYPDAALIVEHQRQRWEADHGTVGAVAMDQRGEIAAATSTGGLFNTLPGRVGDSALIGCGTYADDRGGVSCTGIGEAIIRVVLAKTAVDFLRAGMPPQAAVDHALAHLNAKTRRQAGLILIDQQGYMAYAHNAAHMPVGIMSEGGDVITTI